MTPSSIRPYAPTDRQDVIALLLELNRHEAQVGAPRRTDRAGAEACLADDTDKCALGGGQVVLEVDRAVIGYLAYFWPKAAPYLPTSDRPILHIENIVVAGNNRRRGYGRMLLAHADAVALAGNARAITLAAVVNNALALGAYRAAGYSPVSYEMVKPLDDSMRGLGYQPASG